MVLVMILGGCSTSRVAGPGVYYDDIYYVPGVSRENVNDAFSPVPSLTREQEKQESRALAARQNEYNRSERAYAQQDMRDFSGVQDEYATILADENIQDTDTLLYYNDETGYWVDGFQGSSMDRDYAERLVRFHSPAVRIPYYSPFYSEVVYYNHYDWNVYVDGNYAYAFPTWTNRWYDYHYHNRWHRPYSNFHFGWSYGYPYYGGGYYGFGWNHYRPYYGYNSWYNPYYYGYNSYHHHNHYYGGSGYYNRPGSQQAVNRGMRQGLNSDRSIATSRNTRNNDALKTGTDQPRSTANQRGQASTRDARGTSTAQNNDRAVRGTVSRPQGETKSTGTSATTGRQATRGNYSEGTPTRRSYTPTYSQTEGNTKPVYNRATYTRVSNSPRPAQSTGTVQPRTTNTSPSQTTGSTRSVQTTSPTQSRQVTPAATQTRQMAPATQNTRPVPQRSTTTQPSTGSPTRPAATSPSAPATYQRGSSTAPTRTSTPSSSAPSRSYSAPAPTKSSSSSSYSAPSRSSSGSSNTSGSSSTGGSSSNSSRGGGGRR